MKKGDMVCISPFMKRKMIILNISILNWKTPKDVINIA